GRMTVAAWPLATGPVLPPVLPPPELAPAPGPELALPLEQAATVTAATVTALTVTALTVTAERGAAAAARCLLRTCPPPGRGVTRAGWPGRCGCRATGRCRRRR